MYAVSNGPNPSFADFSNIDNHSADVWGTFKNDHTKMMLTNALMPSPRGLCDMNHDANYSSDGKFTPSKLIQVECILDSNEPIEFDNVCIFDIT